MSSATPNNRTFGAEAEVLSVIEASHRAHHARDAKAIVSQYARDAVIFDLSPPLRSEMGTDAAKLAAWLDSWEGPVDIDMQDFEIAVDGGLAFGHGFYRMSGTPRSEGRHVQVWMRATVCLKRDNGAWAIVHEHTSVPFYMDGSFRAAVDLAP